MTIEKLLGDFSIARKTTGMSDNTIDRINRDWIRFTQTRYTRLSTIDAQDILRWVNEQQEAGMRQSSAYTLLNSMKSVLKYCDEAGIKHSINTEVLKAKPIYRERKEMRPSAVKKATETAQHEWVELIMKTMYTSGLRISEAINLKVSDLQDGPSATITGKGSKHRRIFFGRELHERLLYLSRHNTEYVFELNGKQIQRHVAYYWIKDTFTRAGYDWATPHTLRHSFATCLLRNGCDIYLVSRLLGHENIETTKIYLHLIDDDLRRAHKKYLTVV